MHSQQLRLPTQPQKKGQDSSLNSSTFTLQLLRWEGMLTHQWVGGDLTFGSHRCTHICLQTQNLLLCFFLGYHCMPRPQSILVGRTLFLDSCTVPVFLNSQDTASFTMWPQTAYCPCRRQQRWASTAPRGRFH